MKIYTDTPEGATIVQNTFIDQYMPHANGEFVKVYLYLLRCANTGRDLSLSSIADVFDHTEKDVRRALSYWEKQELLHISQASDGSIQTLTFSDFTNFSGTEYHPAKTEVKPAAGSSFVSSVHTEQQKQTMDLPTSERMAEVQQEQEIRQLFYVAEQYLQRPLTSSEQREIIYYYDTLQFSTDLIEYLLEYCISKGCTSHHYMRKVALSWSEAGVSSVLQAKQETNLHNKNYFTVLNTFGIKGRGPATPEQETMSRWFNDFGFSIEIVLEACRRTIRQTHQPNFQYADRILEQWHQSGVVSMADITQLDKQRKQEQKKTAPIPQKNTSNRFNNFTQREYDYEQLEKQLLTTP